MAQIVYRGNLSSAEFPMTIAEAGRSVIIPGPDNNFDRRVDPEGAQKDAGIPQAIYMENVLPTARGYQSVGYSTTEVDQIFGGIPGGLTVVSSITVNIFNALNTSTGRTLPIQLAIISNNTIRCNYTDAHSNLGLWVGAILPAGWAAADEIYLTTGLVRGVSYLWNNVNKKLYTLTCATVGSPQVTFADVTGTITGIAAANIGGICSAYNYLIAIDSANQSIRWSSTTTPVDFTASLVTGAGAETPTGVRTEINYVISHPAGFYIYTSTNVIFAVYTGNSKYPWKFREVSDSGGAATIYQLTGSTNTDKVFQMDEAGKLVEISGYNANAILAEATNFFSNKKYQDTFNQTTNTFSSTRVLPDYSSSVLVYQQFRRIAYLLDRYICVSYRGSTDSNYSYVLIWDILLKRYGKLKVSHNLLFASERYIYTMDYNTGDVKRLSFDLTDSNTTFSSVLILGKFQYVRSRFITLEEIELESEQDSTLMQPNSSAPTNFTLACLATLDGKNFQPYYSPTLVNSSGTLRAYKCHKTGMNHSLVLKGAFDINTVQLKFTPNGKR